MTWSILARDEHGHLGVAIASRFFAVGALCVHTRRDVGALSTQALMNPLYGPAGIEAMERGYDAASTIAMLTAADDGREQRQLHLLPVSGPGAAHTGSACVDWCGHLVLDGLSVAGNMLAGPRVIEATAEAYQATAGRPMAERLLAAMDAGEAAGGDKRGKQAAALRVHTDEDYPALDLRVDDHAEPLVELRRLYEKSLERFLPFVQCLPGRGRPSGITERPLIEAHIEKFHAERRRASGQVAP
ncbi:DUF1028 domain-containing protein [Hydrogenophaga sp.]|uniref:DUF1028 domain-containing protein n=1 Tax=Hydrogenophaga sp. TaxID=1904254 RepID=UPI002719D474|nr:DUF1028 domain-containing protein [Hydrogenophaga sp.]MDO8903105.1 DUF1028 domain-containing protein [Hydrogenophaga sp.]